MTRTFNPLMAGFWVLLAAAIAFALFPRLMDRTPPRPMSMPAALPSEPMPAERSSLPQDTAPAEAPTAGGIGIPHSSLFSDGGVPRASAATSSGAPAAAPVSLVGVRPPQAFADRPGGLFAAPSEGR